MGSNGNSDYKHLEHGFGPCYDENSEILILGSFPSAKSREQNFFYGHPMNRFWRVLGKVYGVEFCGDIDKKKRILQDIHVALYDVIDACDIIGSSDASIKNPVITDLFPILNTAKIRLIVLNGKTAGRLFEKYHLPILGPDTAYVVMPSTSPANAAMSLDRLVEAWKVIC